ncbi:class II glutamine amidotransferase [Methylobacterium symbioticum]|jgi:predicted glutamine amidotransferase|uniref:Gamma-glutamyl-hercynylcysteine sulfoxide hydrolase n=1 Tax=Methylobacterium symbioticum TaxID=2584084 RepID=A0A509ED17_9HYPH|nr:class II glutamine amidotransferase [Methylobacterium symbioticum]VUD72058.1 Gamma-glutamyl-hercynylcysteine sulfoxide hydrolase [Methylobacterium symbioticum]
MCRWIAYRGRTIPLERYVTEPAHSLVSQSIQALESTAATNGDGFGLGWYGEHPEPGRYREVQPAWSDDNLRYLCRHLHSHLFFGHVRAATGTPITRPNCHPFTCGPWLFMHNGYVGDWTRLRRRIEALIPDELYPSRGGTTDSEALFLAILGAGLMGPAGEAGEPRDPVAATVQVLATITDLVGGNDGGHPFRFTAALADGRDLYAFRYAANDDANSMYVREGEAGVVIVSEPLDKEHATWTPVPDNSVVIARRDEPVTVVSLKTYGLDRPAPLPRMQVRLRA